MYHRNHRFLRAVISDFILTEFFLVFAHSCSACHKAINNRHAIDLGWLIVKVMVGMVTTVTLFSPLNVPDI